MASPVSQEMCHFVCVFYDDFCLILYFIVLHVLCLFDVYIQLHKRDSFVPHPVIYTFLIPSLNKVPLCKLVFANSVNNTGTCLGLDSKNVINTEQFGFNLDVNYEYKPSPCPKGTVLLP